jgi:hypothetical protein
VTGALTHDACAIATKRLTVLPARRQFADRREAVAALLMIGARLKRKSAVFGWGSHISFCPGALGFKLAGSVALTEVVTKILIYYFHERIWAFVPWGKR